MGLTIKEMTNLIQPKGQGKKTWKMDSRKALKVKLLMWQFMLNIFCSSCRIKMTFSTGSKIQNVLKALINYISNRFYTNQMVFHEKSVFSLNQLKPTNDSRNPKKWTRINYDLPEQRLFSKDIVIGEIFSCDSFIVDRLEWNVKKGIWIKLTNNSLFECCESR